MATATMNKAVASLASSATSCAFPVEPRPTRCSGICQASAVVQIVGNAKSINAAGPNIEDSGT